MSKSPSGTGVSAVDRWDRLHEAMASQERRMILYSLTDAPEERRLPLPEAAMAPSSSLDAERVSIALRHVHLPLLADAGYIRWERDPFCVQRGPYFEEAATVMKLINDSIGRFPASLIAGCEIYEELFGNAQE